SPAKSIQLCSKERAKEAGPGWIVGRGDGRREAVVSNRSVLRYFRPVSVTSVTTTAPASAAFATWRAAATFAPEEKPQKMPSRVARRRAVAIASASVTVRKPSQREGSQRGGTRA